MKNALRFVSILLLLCSGASIYGQSNKVGQNSGSLIYLDGVNVIPKAEITLKRDDLLLLEAFDLMPQSEVEFRAKQGISTVLRESYTTDAEGAMHKILFFPKKNNHLKCQVKYVTRNGKDRKLEFELKAVTFK